MTPSEQARADAFADAETLRRELGSAESRRAATIGAEAANAIRAGYDASAGAVAAARAAFCAVPGLMGSNG